LRKSGYSEDSINKMSTDSNKKYLNSSKFSTLKKPIKYSQSRTPSNINYSISNNQKKFGNRKRTLETSPSLACLSRKLTETKHELNSVKRKQSENISTL